MTTPEGVFRIASGPVMLQGTELGTLRLANALDERYADEFSELSRASTLIVSDDRIVAATLPSDASDGSHARRDSCDGRRSKLSRLGASEYAVQAAAATGRRAGVRARFDRRLGASGRSAKALRTMGGIALGAFALAALASFWLARTIARPIDKLSASLATMTRGREFDHPLTAGGDSLEVDTLTTAFNTMMHSVKAAEAETSSAYLGHHPCAGVGARCAGSIYRRPFGAGERGVARDWPLHVV